MGKINKILLIEDNAGDALLLREALRDLGDSPPFALAHVGRLDEGVRAVSREVFDAILLDLSLPDAHGIDTVGRMQEAAPRLPIVVLTGLDDDAAALDAVRAGAQDYLVKGQFDGRLLLRALSYAIERKRAQEEIEQHLRRIIALKDINVALTATLDRSAVLKILLQKLATLMPELSTVVSLWREDESIFEAVACRNLIEAECVGKSASTPFGQALTDQVARTKSLVIVSDVDRNIPDRDSELFRKHGLTAYMGVPLFVDQKVLGVLSFYANNHRAFPNHEIEFLSAVATQASVAIHNCQVHGEVKQLAARLERSNQIKEEFLGVISHELRTPLNVVKGYVELLKTNFFGELTAEQDVVVDKIAGQIRDQLAMINSILNAITIESDVATLHTSDVSLQDFMDELQSVYFSPPDKGLVFQWRYSPTLPVVKTDKTKLKHILQNLINNAVKFTREGCVTVSAALLDSSVADLNGHTPQNGKIRLKFEVSDTGIGIPKESLPVIFEKFTQVDSSTTRVHGGIGLGLHIVKRCTELLQGTVNVESEPGRGSTFSVTIPCEVERNAVSEPASDTTATNPKDFARMN